MLVFGLAILIDFSTQLVTGKISSQKEQNDCIIIINSEFPAIKVVEEHRNSSIASEGSSMMLIFVSFSANWSERDTRLK